MTFIVWGAAVLGTFMIGRAILTFVSVNWNKSQAATYAQNALITIAAEISYPVSEAELANKVVATFCDSNATLYSGKNARLPRPEITAIAALASARRSSDNDAETSNIFQLALGEALVRFGYSYVSNGIQLSENDGRMFQEAYNTYYDTNLDIINSD